MNDQNPSRRGLVAAAVVGLAILLTSILGVWENSELAIYDRWFQIRGVEDPGTDIIIIALDEKSISSLGPLPWSRQVHAEMLGKLSSARVVAVDILFDQVREAAGDQALADAIRQNGHVVLASMFTYEKNPQSGSDMQFNPPLERFSANAAGIGFINMPADRGNIVRKLSAVYPVDNQHLYPSFSLAAYLAGQDLNPDQVTLADNHLTAGTLTIPLNKQNQSYINFYGPGGTFPTYSFVDILEGKVQPDIWQDKTVLIGTTSPEQRDYYDNPFTAGTMVLDNRLPSPGIEIHASALKTALTGTYISRVSNWINVPVLLLIWVAAMFCSLRRGPWLSLLLSLLFTAALAVTAYLSWLHFKLWINLAAPLMMVAGVYLTNTAENIIRTNLEKRRISNMFSRYISPDVVEQLIREPGELQLGGREQEVTLMFVDIRGFTRFSDGKPGPAVVKRLNEFFEGITEVIFKHGGMLDKYLGDGLMAIFGAPIPRSDHAARAAAAAVEMTLALDKLNRTWTAQGEATMGIGIGINTAQVVLGNIGTSRRMDYTAIGEGVNLASRLEALNKDYGTQIIVSENTMKQIGDDLPQGWKKQYIGDASIRGIAATVPIYTLSSPDKSPEGGMQNQVEILGTVYN